MSLSRADMPGYEVSVPLPDDGGNNQNGRLVRFEKYEGTVILGLAVFAVVAVTSFLPRAVMTIALVVVVVVFLLVWKKVKRRFLANAPPPPLETITSTDSPSDSDTQTCLSKVYDDRLAEYEAKMRTRISSVGLVPLLEVPAGGFMTQEERIIVTSKENDPEKVSTIISILRKKTDKDYFKFCDILEKSGNEHWANHLRVIESPSSDIEIITPEAMLSPTVSVKPDVNSQHIINYAASQSHSYPVPKKVLLMQSYSNISDVQSSTNGDIDDIELQGQNISQDDKTSTEGQNISQDDKTSTEDDSRVPTHRELHLLSRIMLFKTPRYSKGWRQLCYKLGIPSNEIHFDHSLRREFEMEELLIRWRDEYSFQKPSWRFLLSAIEDTYGHRLADSIRSEFDLL